MQSEWYILKTPEGACQVVEVKSGEEEPKGTKWGPLPSYQDAVAKRVGLIRAGKCQPV